MKPITHPPYRELRSEERGGGPPAAGGQLQRSLAAKVAAAKTVRAIVEFPLRAIVAWRQIAEARMWLRNGNSAYQLAINYALPPLCRSLRDLDVLLVQFSAAGGTAGVGAGRLFELMVDR